MNEASQSEADCFQIAHADRVGVISDTASYFRAFEEAARLAKHSLLIIAWDIDSRTRLLRDDETVSLRQLLVGVAEDNPGVQIHVLCWEAGLVYALEREAFKRVKLDLTTPDNLHFELDDSRQPTVALHQKIVVVDDQLAFCGGIDLTRERWDTEEHLRDDERRTDPDGDRYGPFHDVQMVVDADCARTLAAIARSRWEEAVGESLEPVAVEGDAELWPASIAPDFRDVDVCIARTLPPRDERPAVTEVQRRYERMLEDASDRVYIETQYLTSDSIRDLLVELLSQPDGPEVTVVTPRRTPGIAEQATVGVARWDMLKTLHDVDEHGHFRAVHPVVGPDGAPEDVYVHSKVCVVDDTWLHVGSANLTNRSLSLDYECDLSIQADSDGTRRGVQRTLAKLIGIHLGLSPDAVDERLTEDGSIHRLLDDLGSAGVHRLMPLGSDKPFESVGLEAYADPARPIDVDAVADDLLDQDEDASRPFEQVAGLLLLTIVLAAVWRFTPLSGVVSPESLTAMSEPLRETVAGPWIAFVFFTVLATFGVPVVLLTLVSGFVMGVWLGGGCAIAGATAAAAISFWMGRWMGLDTVRRLSWSDRVDSIHRRIVARGPVAVAGLRLIPVAPFVFINLLAGTTEIRWRSFIVTTVLTMAPGTLVLVYYGSQLLEFVQGDSFVALLGVAAVVAVVVALGFWVERKLDRPRAVAARGGGEQ